MSNGQYLVERAQWLNAARQVRNVIFADYGPSLAEPAHDIMLYLFVAKGRSSGAMLTDAADSAGVSVATARRWFTALIAEGLLTGRSDVSEEPDVALTDKATGLIRRYLEALPAHP